MVRSVNHFGRGIKFATTDVKYSLDSSNSKWNGIEAPNLGNPVTAFTGKNNLNSTWQTDLIDTMKLWDYYSKFTISQETGNADADIYAYRANFSNTPGGTALFETKTTETTFTGNIIGGDYARSEFAFDNTAMAGYDADPLYRGYILLHEIGHSLGLNGDNNNNISTNYTTDMTVMSYNITLPSG